MDHQAGTSGALKTLVRFLRNTTPFVFWIGVVFLFSGDHVFAQATPNPLSVTVSIEAIAPYPAIPPQYYPDVVPPPPGPINMVDTIDSVIFRGMAYPKSTVSILKNSEVIGSVQANEQGNFDIRLRGHAQGTYSFGIRAEDSNKNLSKMLTFTVFISGGVATLVDGIFIPPTITSNYVEIKRGETITFSGFTAPMSEVRLSLGKGSGEVIKKIQTAANGAWSYAFKSSEFALGDYEAKARSLLSDNLSPFSEILSFRIGDTSRLRAKLGELAGFRKRCDLNNDNRVNLLDFSIMAFWYKRMGFPPKVDLNTDNAINLTDLSILAYCWTG